MSLFDQADEMYGPPEDRSQAVRPKDPAPNNRTEVGMTDHRDVAAALKERSQEHRANRHAHKG